MNNCCERVRRKYCKGNIEHTSKSLAQVRCKLVAASVVLVCFVYFCVQWINWDSGVIFYEPTLNDIYVGNSIDVSDERLESSRWKEKKGYMVQVFEETCREHEYDILTNLNVRILGSRVEDSIAYICQEKRTLINLKITPANKGARLVCVEYYGAHSVVRDDRYHPLNYSYVNDITVENKTTKTYEETCLLYQTRDLLRGTWKP